MEWILIIMLIAFLALLPIIIPAAIILIIIKLVKNKKEKEKTANNNMYINSFPQQNQFQNNGQETAYGNQFVNDSHGFIQPSQPPQYAYQNQFMNNGQQICQNPMPQPPKPVRTKVQKTHEPLSSSVLMLIVGVVLMVLSGIAFAAANWVNTSPAGRVAIIITAAAVSIGISAVLYKAAKLKNTSSAFYIIGLLFISISFITSCHYKMLGNWLSTIGDGSSLVYSVSFLIAAVGAYIGSRIYKSKKIFVISLILSALSLTSALFETAYLGTEYNEKRLILSILIVQCIITAAVHYFKMHESSRNAKEIRIAADIVSILYLGTAFIYIPFAIAETSLYAYFYLSILMAQAVFYGIKFDKKWLFAVQSGISFLFAMLVSSDIEDSLKNPYNIYMIFGLMTAVIYVINQVIPKLKNNASSAVSTIGLVIGGIVSIAGFSAGEKLYLIIPAIFAEAVLYKYVFSSNKKAQTAAGLFTTVLPFFMTISLTAIVPYQESKIVENISFASGAIITSAAVFILTYLPKIAPDFSAKHPRYSNSVLYANTLTFSILLFVNSTHGFWEEFKSMPLSASIPLYVLIIAALMFSITTSFKLKNNLPALVPVAALLNHIINFENFIMKDYENTYLSLGFFIAAMAVSITVFGKAIKQNKNGRTVFDINLFTSWILFSGIFSSGKYGSFLGFMSISLYFLCFVKRSTKPSAANILFIISAISTAFAMNACFEIKLGVIESKILLAGIALFGAAVRYAWRYTGKTAKIYSTAVFIIAYAGLIIDAVFTQTGGNTLFVLAVSTVILILSFISKSKTWFIASLTAMIGIIIYASKDYLESLSWWVYLFAAGLILIGIAAANEYCKQKGETFKSKTSKVFAGWKW